MKLTEAMDSIEKYQNKLNFNPKGYIVIFEKINGHSFTSDQFPERNELPIKGLQEAISLADNFARANKDCVNIEVRRDDYGIIPGYAEVRNKYTGDNE